MTTTFTSSPPKVAKAVVPFDLTVDFYARMVETGLIPRDRRVMLLDGRLYEKMARTTAHGFVGAALNKALIRCLPNGWCLWPESTVVLDPKNAPLPDFAVIRGANPLDYGSPDRYPGPNDVGLVIEIAVSSVREDLTSVLEHYARALIPAYWVLDVKGKRILVHHAPRVVDGKGSYDRVETYHPGQSLPLVLDGQEVARVPFDEILR